MRFTDYKWENWLLPKAPPKREEIEGLVKQGEIWSFWDTDGERCVVATIQSQWQATVLAGVPNTGRDGIGFGDGNLRTHYAVFVALITDPEPPDPDLIYQFLYK